MESREDLVFVFIKEVSQFKSSHRKCSLAILLDLLQMEAKSPEENESAIDIIRSGEYKSNAMFINLEHPDLVPIIQQAREYYPSITMIIIWDKNTPNIPEKLNDLEKTYNIKYNMERTNLNQITLKNLFIQINQECNKKKTRYTFIQRLGGGASAEVDLYYDTELKRRAAVKTIRVEGMKQMDKEKVKLEVENMKSIKVPTAIEFYHFEIENDVRYIYMEYADAGTLESRINLLRREGKNFTTDEIFDYLIEIMLALFALNKKGMMHRDIKAENILLKTEKVNGVDYLIAKLSDLGISRQIDGVLENLTSCGTPYYVSPEIAAGEKRYDYNADIWSLGVVLYELITLKKPWFDPKISTQELFSLVFNTSYPKLPKDTDPGLKYLVSLMLRKNPLRRADLFEILKIDFVYEKTMHVLKKFGWDTNVPDYASIYELEPYVHPCASTMNIIDKDNLRLLQDANKIFINCIPHDYKKSFLGGKFTNTRRGEDIINAFGDFKTMENDFKINYSDLEPQDFFQRLLEKNILLPLSHTASNEIEYHIENLFAHPESTFYLFSFDNKNDPMRIDNHPIMCYYPPPENFDYIALSQFIMKQGKSLVKEIMKSGQVNELVVETDERYLKFMHGISLFQHFSLLSMNYHRETNPAPLAFLLNLYQIMFMHYILKMLQNTLHSKSGILGYFSNEIGITYCFKDTMINNLELKHVVFRNNKAPPGNYMRLVYSSDKKAQILPNFNDLRTLLILYEFKLEIPELIKWRLFEAKELNEQLNEVVFKFIKNYVSYGMDELVIPTFLQPYVTDFGSKDTPEFPEGLLKFLLSYFNIHKDYTLKEPYKPYKIIISLQDCKNFEFLNSTLIKEIQTGRVKVIYQN